MERPGVTALHGYSRTEINDFLSSVADERGRLEAAIAGDEECTRAARAALGTHRVMVAMLLQAQREIDEIRARAEADAAELLAASSTPAAPVLDITHYERVGQAAPDGPVAAQPPLASGRAPESDESTEYFNFLRGALVDDAPLGPRPESA